MKIFLLFILFCNFSYGASRSVHFPDDLTATPGGSVRTGSTARSAGIVDSMLIIWSNVLNDSQRKTFSSTVAEASNFQIVKAFCLKYSEVQKAIGNDDVSSFDVLKKMGLFSEEDEALSTHESSSRTLKIPAHPDSDDDDREEASDDAAALKSLWSLIEENVEGQLVKKAIDLSSAFSLFCHLYDASFNALTEADDADNINAFMVIENMITSENPPRLNDRLLAQALLALRNAEREASARDRSTVSAPSTESPAGFAVGIAAPATTPAHRRRSESNSGDAERVASAQFTPTVSLLSVESPDGFIREQTPASTTVPDRRRSESSSDNLKEPLLGKQKNPEKSGCCCVVS